MGSSSLPGRGKTRAPRQDGGGGHDGHGDAPSPRGAAEDAQALLRAHFEARFRLPASIVAPARGGSDDDDDDDDELSREDAGSGAEGSEWGGITDDDGDDDDDVPAVEVIDHTAPSAPSLPTMTRAERRAFLSSRPPSSLAPPPPSASTARPAPADPEDAPSLLANDLALQRLLSESHLLASLSPSSSSSASADPRAPGAFAAGRARARATDMRLRALGSKASIFTQRNHPMAIRQGAAAAAAGREERRRREAREAGVVLERAAPSPAGGRRRKARSAAAAAAGPRVDMPGVGRMKGAELRLSDRDVRSIEGSGGRGGAGKTKKRRR